MAFLLQANADNMARYVPGASRIRVSGGVSRFDGLCQRLADLGGVPVHRRDDHEATARGIAYLAAGRPEGWNAGAEEEVFPPRANAALRERYARWRALMREATGV
jgi:glycerol kinase